MAAARPLFVRLETGDLFNPNPSQFQTLRWTYVRLEDGTELLVGPAGLTPTRSVVARIEPGDVDILQTGFAP